PDLYGISKKEIFEVEQGATFHEALEHARDADGAGEKDADHSVAGEAGLGTHEGDPETDQDPKGGHDERDPLPELRRRPLASKKYCEDAKADGDAQEGAMSEGIAEKGHAAADHKRTDHAATEAHKDESKKGVDVEGEAEHRPVRDGVRESVNGAINPG